ncbi:MAG TPA: HD domain-containing phosphohydrolase [bacterium]|nr:HD domain-containing phosphohydrolase [bacterium]
MARTDRFEKRVDSHPLPAWLYDAGTLRFLHVNEATVSISGYTRRGLLAMKVSDVCVDAAGSRTGFRMPAQWRLRLKDGKAIDVKSAARAVRTRGRDAILVVAHTIARRPPRLSGLQTVYDLSRRLRTARAAEEMYPVIVEQARALLRAYHGCLALLNPEGQVFTRVYTVGVVGEKIGSTFPSPGTRSGRVASAGTPFVSPDFSRERIPDWMAAGGYRAFGPLAIVPVPTDEGIIGTLCVARARGSDGAAFTGAEVHLLDGIAEITGMAIQRARLHRQLQDANVQMVVALAHTVSSRDAYTARHCKRVAALAERVARQLGCSDRDVRDIRCAARLHDIGKVGLPDAVLRKPTALTDEEWSVMRQHPLLGEEILRPVHRLRGPAKLVRHHQEAWDGSGYPDGLRGEAIPLGARILAVVDAFGAITEARPYRPARTRAEAVAEIKRCAGTQFDPRVVAAFCAVIERRSG